MSLRNIDNQLEILWKIIFQNDTWLLRFHKASLFSIRELSLPLEIAGFEIMCHAAQGWEKDMTYEIYDFEDDHVKFFCESYEIEKITSTTAR